MAAIPFTLEYDFEYARMEQLTPLIRRITARNPSGFTFHGTGTYIVGRGKVAVIDPGPLLDEHINTLIAQLAGEEVTHILITHTHNDHSPAAAPLKQHWGVKTWGFGPHGVGAGETIEEGGDLDFVPDVLAKDGDIIKGEDWTIECVHTPGHTSNHLCFALKEENALFTGDHVMGWSTSVIGPPDGNMTHYMESLEKLLTRPEDIYWPTHGTCIKNVKHFVQAFINHRLARERQILDCMASGQSQIEAMVPVMYKDTDKRLYPAAARSVLAALIRMLDTGQVLCSTAKPGLDSAWSLA